MAAQFPQHHRAGSDFDQGVQAEAGQRYRPCGDGGHGQDDDAGPVPAEGDPLKDPAAAKKSRRISIPCGSEVVDHGKSRSGRVRVAPPQLAGRASLLLIQNHIR
jgi:hypothetical protein